MAMYMYAIAIVHHLKDTKVHQALFADNTTAAGNLTNLKEWWEQIVKSGPEHSYYPNALKTWLVVTRGKELDAATLFEEMEVSITTNGKKHLGAAIGTQTLTLLKIMSTESLKIDQ